MVGFHVLIAIVYHGNQLNQGSDVCHLLIKLTVYQMNKEGKCLVKRLEYEYSTGIEMHGKCIQYSIQQQESTM